ncbi:MAG: efflux RND transporter permease subunit [Pirellulaceae bacterium]|nr:efflux RND transporter permease subunit [Pirellulaceae bacterium]
MTASSNATGGSGSSAAGSQTQPGNEVAERLGVARLAAAFYRDRRLTALTVLLIVVSGLSSLMVLPRREDPLLRPRVAQLTTVYPGADAEKVEALVTEKIERRLRDVAEIKRLRSVSRAGVSLITIELLDAINEPDQIWPKVRGKMEDAIGELPAGCRRPEFHQPEMSAFAWIGGITWVGQGQPRYGVMRRQALELKDRLLALPGTKLVELFGDPQEEILVEIDPARMAASGVSPAMVAARLSQADVKTSSGMLRSAATETVVQFRNQFSSLQDIANTQLDSSTPGYTLHVRDIATLRRGTPEPPGSKAMIDMQPSVVLGVILRSDFRIDKWAALADDVVAEFQSQLPSGIKLDIIMQQEKFVTGRIHKLLSNLALSMVAVSLTTWLFLGWRSSLLVTATLPLATMIVLTGMRLLDIPIHQMSVTGLIIALGMLIDNAIIAADEVEISLRRGLSAYEAAVDMVRRLAAPLAASTLTTAFAFAPIALMEGPTGEFVGSIALTVILAVFSSLFLSLTILPTVAAWLQQRVAHLNQHQPESFHFLKQLWRHGIAIERLTAVYRRALSFVFARPLIGIAIGVALPIAGFVAATRLSEQFFPPSDRSQFHIEVELQPSASMAQTEAVIQRLDRFLRNQPRIAQVSWFFGNSAPSFYYNVISRVKNSPHFAQGIVNLDSEFPAGDLIRQLQAQVDIQFPEARILVRQLEQGPPFDAPVEVRISGPDIDQLDSLGEQLRRIASGLPEVIHTKTMLGESRAVAQVAVRAQQAGWAGLTERDIADQLFSRLEGLQAGSLIEQTEQVPVRVRIADQRSSSIDALGETVLFSSAPETPSGAAAGGSDDWPVLTSLVPISSVADISLTPQRALIARYGGVRINEIKAYLRAEALPSRTLVALSSELERQGFELPPGYRLELGGEAHERNSAVGRLLANVAILVVGMLASMVLALSSFRLTAMISGVAVLSVGLGMGALWLFGHPFGFMAIIGTMGLIGVAINDSIVVVAALQNNLAARLGNLKAMVDTVVEITRHVLATTATTVAGFLPLIMDGGAFWPPLAITIGAGVLGATLIAIVFVPSCMRLIYFRGPEVTG